MQIEKKDENKGTLNKLAHAIAWTVAFIIYLPLFLFMYFPRSIFRGIKKLFSKPKDI